MPETLRLRNWLFRLTALTLGLLLALAGAEVVARIAVVDAPIRPPIDEGLPVLQEPDPELGWRNKAGRVEWPGLGEDGGKVIRMTFWRDGLRATGPEPQNDRPQVVVIGCSYTQGWAVTDEETYPWRLQQVVPSHAVLNYGTAGYGTYQALLSLERHLARHEETPPKVLVYGVIDDHEVRNVAPAAWLTVLALASRAGPLTVPFVTIGSDGTLRRHRLDGARRWLLRDTLTSVAFLEDRLLDLRTRARAEQGRAATEQLLVELRRVTEHHGARLLVAILESAPKPKAHYTGFLARESIEHVDCTVPDQRQFQTPGYNHPDRRINAHWAGCIADRLKKRL